MHGTFVWNELASTDLARAKAAYGEVMGWSFVEFPMDDGAYFLAQLDGRFVAGLGEIATGALSERTDSYWFSFIAVDDVDVRVKSARAAGFTVEREPMEIPSVGRLAVVRDPSGAAHGWITLTGEGPST